MIESVKNTHVILPFSEVECADDLPFSRQVQPQYAHFLSAATILIFLFVCVFSAPRCLQRGSRK